MTNKYQDIELNEIHIGQRWFSENELELGLGEVVDIDAQRVSLHFSASDEQRMYSLRNAPIIRLLFKVGDTIQGIDGYSIVVTNVIEHNSLCTYEGTRTNGLICQLKESEIAHTLVLNKPKTRLLTCQTDSVSWFNLRYETRSNYSKLNKNPVYGLLGARVSLIPHQLYIASTISARLNPRAILADEVGLGKTIEAGLILHQKLQTDAISRAIVIVPDTLVYQWLVELLRRFNLKFSIFDESRCQSLDDSDDSDSSDFNPFESEQLIICSLSFFVNSTKRQAQVLSCTWDMLIVDEAHHLYWTQENASPEYDFIAQLAAHVPSVLLLTATPEQLGASSHFARLRILDSNRFYDFDGFEQEQKQYAKIAKVADLLINNKVLAAKDVTIVKNILKAKNQLDFAALTKTSASANKVRNTVLSLLLDCHGTSRVLFRNTRNTIAGFPKRLLHSYPLPVCKKYQECLSDLKAMQSYILALSKYLNKSHAELLLTPEVIYQSLAELGEDNKDNNEQWWKFDPRVNWLINILKDLNESKVLVICANKFTVIELDKLLKLKHGLRTAVFHENLTILERDRAAAYFAQTDKGAQTLICSEIGSEGRNFQFAHHLILFDLPPCPDLLEQRIGRLDRIGQTQDIHIHIPYIEESAQDILFHWFNDGLNAFTQISLSGQTLFEKFGNEIVKLLENRSDHLQNKEKLEKLISKTQKSKKTLDNKLQKGRDKLLELNSFSQSYSETIIKQIRDTESNNRLYDYIKSTCDSVGIEFEIKEPKSYIMKPSNHMLVQHFPELPQDGVTVTFDREFALNREDILFLSWEHPLVIALMETILSNEYGNSAIYVGKVPGVGAHNTLLECIYTIECTAPKKYNINSYLPSQSMRVIVDESINNFSEILSTQQFSISEMVLNKEQIKQIIAVKKDLIENMVEHSDKIALKNQPDIIATSIESINKEFDHNINRLKELQLLNPNVNDSEIDLLKLTKEKSISYVNEATIRLDAIRLIVSV